MESWLGAVAYTLQLYFDFSGYSDMAIGLGLMIGFRFVENFNIPYISQLITEFWRRWHMSLSVWLRDYLYIPLGGNRNGTVADLRQPASSSCCSAASGTAPTGPSSLGRLARRLARGRAGARDKVTAQKWFWPGR